VEDWSKAIHTLTILKNSDTEFHKKIRIINQNYDENNDKAIEENVRSKTSDLCKFIEVKCLNMMERWEIKRQKWIAMYNKLGKYPKKSSKDEDEKKCGLWQNTMRVLYNTRKLQHNRIEILNSTTGWSFGRAKSDVFKIQYNNWVIQYTKNGKPCLSSKNDAERQSALWMKGIRNAKIYGNKSGYILTDEQINILDNDTRWSWVDDDPFMIQYNKWIKQYYKLGRKPSNSSKDDDERHSGQWQADKRRAYFQRGKTTRQITDEQIMFLNNVPEWNWTENPFMIQYNNWIYQYTKLNKHPSTRSKNADEVRAGKWENAMKLSYLCKKGEKTSQGSTYKLSDEQIKLLDKLEGWKWRK
jgi:hypothetical protein